MISRGQEAAKVGLSSSIRCSAEQVCLCNLGYPPTFTLGSLRNLIKPVSSMMKCTVRRPHGH